MRHDISRDTARFPLVAVATRVNTLACQRNVFRKLFEIRNQATSYTLGYAEGKIINHEINGAPTMDYRSNNGKRIIRKLKRRGSKTTRFEFRGKRIPGLHMCSWRD